MPHLSARARNSPILCGMFDRLNRQHFRTALPPLPVMWHRPLLSGGRVTYAAQFAVLADGSAAILVNPLLRQLKMWRYIEATLLHEMVHASLWHRGERPAAFNGHGPKFQKEMNRLAGAGAFARLW